MSPLYLWPHRDHNGFFQDRLLVVNNALAAGEKCCCPTPTPETPPEPPPEPTPEPPTP